MDAASSKQKILPAKIPLKLEKKYKFEVDVNAPDSHCGAALWGGRKPGGQAV